MLKACFIEELKEYENKEVVISGHIEEKRDIGKLLFLILRDRTSSVQVIFKKSDVEEEIFNIAKKVPKESYVKIKGRVIKNEKAPNGYEIKASLIDVLSPAETPLPIDLSGKIETSLDKRLDWRFLDLRRHEVMNVFLFESKIVWLLEEYVRKNGFVRVFFSRLTGEATEGGADYFPVLYFDKEAFLAQSPQLYKESILASGIDKVYDLGFVYRAEPHHTTRHLTEFMSFDVEFVTDDMEDVLKLQENMFNYAINKLHEEGYFDKFSTSIAIKEKFPRIRFEEAQEIVRSYGVEVEKYDLTPEGERKIGEYAKETYDCDFVFITHYPFEKKPFYLMREEDNPFITLSFDLLFRGLEITSGGLREHRYEQRVRNIEDKGLDPKAFENHLRFWKYGMPPHGGFGLGIERLVEKFLNLDNVREATLLPRDPDRLMP